MEVLLIVVSVVDANEAAREIDNELLVSVSQRRPTDAPRIEIHLNCV